MGEVQVAYFFFSQNLHKKRVLFPTEGYALDYVYIITG